MQFFNSPFGSQTVLKFVVQPASDTFEEEGFAYLAGGALTALIPASGVVKLARGGSKIKAPGKSKVNDSPYSKEFLQGKIDAAKAGIADVRVPVFTKEKLSTGSSEINSFGMEMKSLGEVHPQMFKGKSDGKGTGQNIPHPVLDNTHSGSALKKPDGQHGFNDIIDNYAPHAKEFEIVGGDGVKRKLYQIGGGMKYYDYKDIYNKDLRIYERITTVKDQNGIFEWIVEPNKGVTHRRFIPNGQITGSPNQRP